jgi:hypothetical protein
MNITKSVSLQHNSCTTPAVHSDYTLAQLERTVQMLLILDDANADATQREVAAFWMQHFFYYLPSALRIKARQTVAAIREQRFESMVR